MKKFLLGSIIVVLIFILAVLMFRAPSPDRSRWGQGYESDYKGQQVYMQPDHSYLYYWWMYHIFLNNNVQPTYHVYTPPAGAPSTFRPWMDDTPYRPKPDYSSSSGGFSTPSTTSSPSIDWGSSSGGFSSSPSFSSGSGGFSSGSYSSGSGGFSSGSSSSGTYSSSGGGFSGK